MEYTSQTVSVSLSLSLSLPLPLWALALAAGWAGCWLWLLWLGALWLAHGLRYVSDRVYYYIVQLQLSATARLKETFSFITTSS